MARSDYKFAFDSIIWNRRRHTALAARWLARSPLLVALLVAACRSASVGPQPVRRRHRRDLGAPRADGAAGLHPATSLWLCLGVGARRRAARRGDRVADGDARLSRPPRLRMGAGAAAGDAGLRAWPTPTPTCCSSSGRCRRRCARPSAGSAATTGFPRSARCGGAVLMFVCVLYPYVYLLARTAFLERRQRHARGGAVAGPAARGGRSSRCRCRWRGRPSPPASRWR